MEIIFKPCSTCSSYEYLVNNENDRIAIKRFSKEFNLSLVKAALNTHSKLLSAQNALIFNQTTTSDNRIELKGGCSKKDPLIFKTRVQKAYRKFFYYVIETEMKEFCLTKDWTGQFKEIKSIYVFDINKHNYNN